MADRELKFRAWDVRAGQMIEDAITLTSTGGLIYCKVDAGNPFAHFDGLKWMQFTGLKDDHGKEIYEGDILEATCAPTYEFKPYEVRWSDLRASFVCYRPTQPPVNFINLPLQPSNSMENLKVLGNIYENPELLET